MGDHSRIKDRTGEVYGELTVLRMTDSRASNGNVVWLCRCSCGEEREISGNNLRNAKSCGCKKKGEVQKGVALHLHKDQVNGTRKTALTAKLHKGNKSGVKGVRYNERKQKWNAYIGFRGKQINLGSFNKKEDAIAARRHGEELYHKPMTGLKLTYDTNRR